MEEERVGREESLPGKGRPGGARSPSGAVAGSLPVVPGRAASLGQCPEAPAPLLPRGGFGVTALFLVEEKKPNKTFPPSPVGLLIHMVFLPDVLRRSLIWSS